MADALIFEFGAKVDEFNAAISDVIKEVKDLKTILTSTASEVPKLNDQISSLETNLTKTKNSATPTATAFTKVEDSAKGARIALTNVSQIAQDLPFGFIGIQNNIPGLVQSFGKLSTESGGAVAALKAMGSALIGPAGILLAFSAVTSIVTVVLQKYGSLGNALDALFSKTNLAKKAQEDYNKAFAQAVGSTALEYAEIVILTNALTDLNKPLKERQAAYVELKKISPDVVAGISEESIATGTYTTLLNDNAKAIIQLLKLKAEESAISNILTKNAEELATLKIEENKLVKEQASAQRDLDKAKKEGILVLGAGRNADQLAIIAINNAAKSIKANQLEQSKLNKVADDYLKILDPTIKGIAEIDRRTKELNDTLKEQQKVTKPPKVPKAPKPTKAEKEEQLYDFFGIPFPKDIIKGFESTIKQWEAYYKKSSNRISKSGFLRPTLSPFQLQKPTLEGLQTDETKARLAELQNIAQGYLRVKDLLQNTFFQPLNSAFETLFTKGTFAIKDFTKALLNSIGQIAAKLAATAIVNGLISMFAVPFGGAFAAGGLLGGLGNLLGGIGGRSGSANFGGVQGGGFGMSGSVNMVLRGTDLVGSINRTNSQISRVG